MSKPFSSRPFESFRVTREIIDISPRQVYVEIGSYIGGSLDVYGRSMPDGATLIAVDLPMPVTEGGKVLKERAAELCADGFDCHVVLGDSKKPDIIGRVSSLTSGNIDVLLIDGDHSPEGVRADIKNYVPMVRPGGLVIFHNVGPCTWGNEKSERLVAGVFPAWKELAQQHPQCMLVQELAGYGLVWIGDDCPR